ncbi:MAG: transporter substrate-binding domain-containing protein [Polaromonas sp.]
MAYAEYRIDRHEVNQMRHGLAFRYLQALLLGILIGLLSVWAGTAKAQETTAIQPTNALDRIIGTGVIRIAVPNDLPPFGSADAKGKLEGYDIDVARLLAEDLGVKLELIPVISVNRIPWLMGGNVDLVIANLGVSPERAKAIAFSAPYASFFSGVFGSPNVNVKSPADLQGKKLAVTRNTLEDRELSRLAPKGAEIMRLEDSNATILAFLSGQADLIATGNSVAAVIAKQNPEKKVENKFTIRESPASIGVRRGEPELLNWVNAFVYYRKLSGDLDQLSRKWFGEPLRPLPPF